MKVILSKKGLDSTKNNACNLLIDDGKTKELVMIPIPNDKDTTTYKELKLYKNMPIYDLLIENKYYSTKIKNMQCHADPNISNFFKVKPFLGSVGQCMSAQSLLKNQKINKGDIFIFFGLFNEATFDGNKLSIHDYSNLKHIMFGYLEIGDIIEPQIDIDLIEKYQKKYPWIDKQPHWNADKYKDIKNNCIYIASEHCSFDNNIPGYGMFNYKEDLILTKSNEKCVTHWDLPKPIRDLKITYRSKKETSNEYFIAARRGQEFVIQENDYVTDWAKQLILNHYKK